MKFKALPLAVYLCRCLLLVAALFFLCKGDASAALPAGFVLTEIGGSWQEPLGMAFDETGRMHVWERAGQVWLLENGVKSATPLIDIRDEVGAWEDYGLLGFALDPKFRLNGYIYLMYIVDHHHLANAGTPQYNPAANDYYRPTIGRITRYTARAADGFRSVDPASRLVLLGETASTGFPILSITHGVGTLVFGTDGTLLASCGDGAQLSDAGNDASSQYTLALAEGIIKPKENVGAFRSQMIDSLSGKILRLDPATGDGIPSNPFYAAANPRAPKSRVWVLGLRNPFRMSLKPGTGSHLPTDGNPGVLFVGDVGYQQWEELDVVTGPAMNFGWPVFEGFTQFGMGFESANPANMDAPNPLFGSGGCSQQYFTFRDLIKEATLGVPSWPNPCNPAQQVPTSAPRFVHTRPQIDWRHGGGPSRCGTFNGNDAAIINVGATGAPVSGPQFGGSCSMGGAWYDGDEFPAQYKNTYFHGDWVSAWIRNFVFDSSNRLVSVRDFASGVEGVVQTVLHPTTRQVYFVSIGAGVQRLSYGGNASPTARASSDRTFGTAPLTVQFSSAGSSDPEGQALTYRWDFGDGTPTSTAANPSHVFSAPPGVPTKYTVTLTVTDSASATNWATLVISPNNTPPVVNIVSPVDGTFYTMTGQTVYPLVANVSDAEHSLLELSPRWQTVLHHNDHVHASPPDTNWTTTTAISPIGCDGDTYSYHITLTVTDAAGLATTREITLYPDCTTNEPPTISDITSQAVVEGQSTTSIPFTIGDTDTAPDSLILSAGSSNPTLVPTNNVVFGGSGVNRTVTVTPAVGQVGTSVITVRVSDGIFVSSDSFVLTVFPANNTAPTISSIADQTINEDESTAALAFTIGDAETGPAGLNLSVSSSNPALAPVGNILLGGSGANRTVTVNPVTNQNGTATITLTVSDGQFTVNSSFVLTVSAANDAPTISSIADRTISVGGPAGPIAITVGDVDTPAGALALSGASSNPALVPPGNITFGGAGTSRTVTVTPASGQTGTAQITITVSDGSAAASSAFSLMVSAQVDLSVTNPAAIVIPHVGAATPYPSVINVNGMVGTISRVVVGLNGFSQTWPGDVDVMLVGPSGQKVMLMSDAGGGTPVNGLNFILSDAGVAGLPQTGALNSGTFRPTDFEPGDPFTAPAPTGPYATALSIFNGLDPNGTWSLYAIDDGSGDQGGFAGGWTLTLTTMGGVPSASPTISDIPDQSTALNTATGPIPFTIADSDTPATSLTLSGGSSNPTLVPAANIVFGGTGSNRTVTVTPAASQSGTAMITVTVSDGGNTASDSFLLTVQPPNNTAPTISSIAAQTINEDTITGPLSFTVGDAETSAASLVLNRASSNTTLVPTNNIVFGGSGASRTVTVTPATNQSGTATITVTVSDGLLSSNTTFVVTVNPVNDPPTVSSIADQTITIGGATGPVPFTIGDVDTPLANLTVTSSSSNPTLVPDSNVVLGGTGSNRTVTVTGVPGQAGSSTITISVSDGSSTATKTFGVTASATLSLSYTNSTPIIIPDVGAATPYPSVINVSGLGGTITDISVRLNGFAQTFPNDVDVLLVGPAGQKIVVMSDVGGGVPINNINFLLSDSASSALPVGGPLVSGTFRPTDLETGDVFPAPAPTGTRVTAFSAFNGSNPNGAWSLYASDDGPGDQGNFAGGWSITITTVGAVQQTPQVTWPDPAPITYGTPLSGTQLNATANVPGTFAYTPASGTVLNAATGQTLSVTFTPTDTVNYRAVTVTETIDVQRAALQITAADKSRRYGSTNPLLTAAYAGFVNGDGPASLTTAVSLSTTATTASPVGAYPINAGGATSPNYTITHVNGTLTVTQALLTITADDKTRKFGQPNPTLTANYSGFVNGDTAGSLATQPSLSTPATPASPVGTYPITASGASGANYLITHVNGTLTIIPQDPPVVTLSTNLVAYTEGNGAVLIDPLATVTDGDSANFDTGNLTVAFTAAGAGEDRLSLRSEGSITVAVNEVSYEGVLIGIAAGGTNGATPLVVTLNANATPTAAQAVLRSVAYQNVSATPSTLQRTVQVAVSDGDGGTSVPKTIAIAVTGVPENPVITWATPAPITYATALGAEQLNSTANVPGNFVYTPLAGTVLHAGNGQALSVVFSPTDAINYRWVTQAVSINVLKAALTVTAANKSKVYGGPNPPFTVTYAGFVNGDSVSSLTTPVSLSTPATPGSPVGTYPITAGGATSPDYLIAYVDGALAITPAPLTITADDKTRKFGQPNPALTASYSGFVNGDTATSLDVAPSLITPATPASPVGTYPITVSGASDANYLISHVNGTLTVTPQDPPVVTLSTNLLAYTEGTGAVLIDPLATVTDIDSADFDTGNLTVAFTASGASEDRLSLRSEGSITVAVNEVSYEGVLIGIVSGGTNGATPLVVLFNANATSAAAQAVLRNITYANVSSTPSTLQRTVQVTVSDGDGGTSVPKTIAISVAGVPENPVITWATPAPISYGAVLGAAELGATANVPGSFVYNPPAGTVLHAGNGQPLSVVFSPTDAINYRSVTQAVSINVLKAALTITAANKSKVYGGPNPPFTVTYAGFVNGDSVSSLTTPVSLSTPATPGSPVGTYPITAGGATSPDYLIAYVDGALAITPAPLTIAADDKTRKFGQSNPALTASYSGFVNGDTAANLATPAALSTAATPDSPVGTYPITASGATSANYSITHVNGTLTIIQQDPPVVSLSTNLLAYTEGTGAVLIDPLATVADVDSADFDAGNLTVAFTAAGASEDRLALRTEGSIGVAGNEVSYEGVLIGVVAGGTDGATPLVVTFNANTTSPAAQAVLRNITYANLSSTPSTLQRAVQVTVSDGDGGTSVPKTLAISVAGVPENPAITWATPAPITYGTALGGAQLNATANVPGNLVYTPPAGTILNAGNAQPLSVAFTPADAINYRSVTQAVSIDVLKAPLTITAGDKTKLYGAPNPALTATYSGFVNGDSASSLTTPVGLSTTATPASPVGAYPINASGATSPNYIITHVSGTLAVTPTPLTITADDKTRVFGQTNPPLTASYHGFVNGDTAANLDTPATLSTPATATSPAGTYPIVVSGAAAANYIITHLNGVLTVMPQNPPVVTLSTDLLAYTEGMGAVLIDPLAALTDSDSADFDGGNLTIEFTASTPDQDRLDLRSEGTGPGQIDVSGDEVSYEGLLIASITGGDGGAPLVITFNASVTPAIAQAVLRKVTYENISSTPSTLQRSVQVTASDGDGGTSVPKTIAIAVTGVPNNPVITWAAPAPITYGTALGGAQLNASANVSGTFGYNPASGTILNASNGQVMSVIFTPTDSINYRSITQSVSIDVLKAQLTITASDKTKVYGSTNPVLTASYSGFVNSEGVSVLTTPVSLSTAATTGSPEGAYPIVPSGATAANYAITFVNGTLTVTRAPLTITADDKSRMFGQTNPPLTARYVGFVNGDTAANLTTPVSLTTAATIASPVGTYPIVASGASAANYTITHVNGTLTITAAPPPAATLSFTNPAAITIPSVGAATPYPSIINVSGMGGSVSQVVVRLNGFRQTWPNDVDVMLVGPTGQKVMLMSDVGGGVPVTGINFTFSNNATASLPRSTVLTSGTFKPTDFEANDPFPAPVAAGPYVTNLAVFNGTNPNGTWSLYVVDDGPGDSGSFSNGWSLTISSTAGASAPPVISDIPNQSTSVGTPTAAIPFTVGDPDTPLTNLSVSGVSSNQAIVPNGNIVFGGGSGANRTVTITPAPGQSGTAPITISVSDGITTVSDSFTLTVLVPNNTPPTISTIADQTVAEDTGTGSLNFTVGDAETAAGNLTVSRGSSNPALVPTNNIVLGGTGANRTVTITPAPNQSGVSTITCTVSDGQATTSTSFTVTVTAVNDMPTISDITDRSIGIDSTTGPLAFTIGDVETPAANLTLSADSSNPVLVPVSNITFGGSGSNRTVIVLPAVGQVGNSTITITVSDGLNTTSDTFLLTVSLSASITQSFTNAASITIPTVGAGVPYPSTINISGLAGTITQVVARLNGFAHTFSSDADILLVGPGGQKVMLVSDAGNGVNVTGINLTLADTAAALVPQNTLVSGTYKPTDYTPGDTFPAPAPAGPYGTNLTAFNGLSANGLWSLYAADDGTGDQGSIAAGWSLTITTVSTSAVPTDASAIHHPTLYISRTTDGLVEIWVSAGPGEECQIEASTDLENWKPIGTVQSDSGITSFTDFPAETRTHLFYRVVTIP